MAAFNLYRLRRRVAFSLGVDNVAGFQNACFFTSLFSLALVYWCGFFYTGSPGLLSFIISNMVIIMSVHFALRCIYYALFAEAHFLGGLICTMLFCQMVMKKKKEAVVMSPAPQTE